MVGPEARSLGQEPQRATARARLGLGEQLEPAEERDDPDELVPERRTDRDRGAEAEERERDAEARREREGERLHDAAAVERRDRQEVEEVDDRPPRRDGGEQRVARPEPQARRDEREQRAPQRPPRAPRTPAAAAR